MFVPNVVSLTSSSLQIYWQNLDGGISDFWISCKTLIKGNCHNSRTSDDIDVKLGTVTKLNLTREAKKRPKKLTMKLCRKIVTSLTFFQFMANLEESGR